MKRKCLVVGIGIISIALLILTSLTNVVGYQSFQLSNQTVINNEVNQKELLFQTIVDIANNKEIQQVILKSQGFFNPDIRFPILKTPVLTKDNLKQMYVVGLVLSKFISKARMYSLIEKYKINNQFIQKEITSVIKKDVTLKSEITQLHNSDCDCEKENTTRWRFPVVCAILEVILIFFFLILYKLYYTPFLMKLFNVIYNFAIILCDWGP